MTDYAEELQRIEEALDAAERVLSDFTPGKVDTDRKSGGDPVTAADHAVDAELRRRLPRDGEGWFSEETTDDLARLDKRRVWIVDPLDGTKEFVTAIPEWCVSVGLVEDGVPVAGGILNPASKERIVGARGRGVTYNGAPAKPSERASLEGGVVLASRSEVKRGEWAPFANAGFEVRAVGSVAYKLALVAAGRADATWTLVPKNEWDVAAGTSLVLAAGGLVWEPGDGLPVFNRRDPLLRGLVAHPVTLEADVREQVAFGLSEQRAS